MCFVKSAGYIPIQQAEPEPIERHQADASLTKNSQKNIQEGYRQNIKTAPLGLKDSADVEKKTLLGE